MINSADEYMKSQISKMYEIATEARKKGIDPSDSVEIVPAPDLAARVEGIVGPKGIAEYIRSLPHDKSRTQIAFMAAEAVLEGKFGDFGGREKLIEQALRTGTAVLTEGVLVAPTEGISSVKIHQNLDGTEYLAVYYSGPIRSAGGTAAALSVLLADFLRRKIGLAEWRPTDTTVERYLEEMELYDARAARLQYKPSDDEFRHIVRNCPVCVTGDPTEEFEVGAYRNVPGIETNRIRGGMVLVLCEGIAQKAAKVLGQAKKLGIDWSWLESVIKAPKAKEAKVTKIEPNPKYIEEVVAGRPVIAYPSRFGGFRLRYGRTRISGFMAKGIHPATMIILDSFPAIGTQFKLERPGKGCVLTPCETIEPPVVRLKDGSVVRVESREHAEKIKDNVHTVLFIGDILVSYGDFLKSNSPLLPAGYNEEWWLEELRDAIELKQELKNIYSNIDPYKVDFDTALKISKETGIPLHPKFTFFWSNISNDEVKELIRWLSSGEWKSDLLNPLNPKELRVVYDPAKSILEKLLVPHRVERDQIIIEGENAKSIFISLGLQPGQKPDQSLVNSIMKRIDDYTSKLQSDEEKERSVDLVSILSGIKIRDKAGTWIGSRMGRPEKSRERHMKPAVHSLFPIGNAGGKTRNIIKAYKDAKARKLKYDVTVEIARMRCPFCGGLSFSRKCQRCGKQTKPERICSKCGKPSATEFHICSTVQTKPGKEIKSKTVFYDSRPINIVEIVEEAAAKTKVLPEEVKCVNGLVSELKIPEPLEKGILRAVHDVSVFKDGTCRFDATNVPVTHFYPREIGTPISKLRELGYLKDAYGNELKSEDQLVELLPHDMIVSERCLKYMARVARFVDDELVKIYGLPPYYNLKEDRDIIGHLVIELSPHTSCGIASRIIGTTKAHVCYAHPYLFAASRRDCLQGNTMMYYKNDEELHASTISEMFIRYSKRPDLPKIIDGEWELIDLTDQNVFALGTDINGNAEEKKIKFIMRKPYSGQLVKIIAQNNQEIIATPDHRVWVFDPKTKQLKEKRVRELSENDLLASLNKVNLENPLINEPNKVNQLDELDLLEFFLEDKESVKMTVRTNKSFAKEVIKRFGKNLKTLGDYLNMSKRQIINSFYRAPYSIPLYSYVKLKQEGENNFWLGFKRNFGKVPLKIKITDKLLRLFGYYISEGWAWRSSKKGKESYHIGIAASDPIIRQDIKNCIIHSLKVPVYEDEKGVYITSKIYYKLFTEKLKFGNNAYTKDIPDWIFNLPEEKIYAFLGGCYQGDGNVYDFEVKYCTVSEKLASKMYFLLTRLGMSPTLKIEKDRPTTSKFLIDRYQKLGREPPKTTLHYVCLYSIDSKKIASKINLIGEKGRKLKVIEKLIKKDKETDKVLNTVRRYIKSEKDIRVLEIKSLEYLDSSCLPEPYVYDIQLESDKDKIFACGKGMLLSHNCDGDENAIMLLMDGLLNFSKHYLPVTRGGQMDAPIVMMTHIDPSEVDDQVHALEVVQGFPSSFYEASWRFAHPSECKIEIVSDRLGKENETYNLWFTHYTPDMNNGALTTQYVYLKSMKDKISAQLGLAKKIAAVDARDAAERLIMSHFLPDLYGNLRSFSTQQVRCVDCNMKYRRVPLSGKCTKCGGKLLLTVNRGGIEKYLKITKNLIDEYNLPNYLRQRIQLLERDIQSIFEDETSKQFNLAEFM